MSMVFIGLPEQLHAQDCHCALCLGRAKYHLISLKTGKQTNRKTKKDGCIKRNESFSRGQQ